ncbi:MAG: ABC transporter substrate-binding protein [Anaerolineaceae bacterium]|nr:ABC transporter substrate-binding protein [Anaerolineaceae bacterium]MDD4043600.1 ABC transporter substrate-binding protein [Anaerolineaceae bacterium]MDD4578146.1 ABC transporter substrate-binding protein [Anaerolineaceae bacterium]
MKKRFLLLVALVLVAAMLVGCTTETDSVLDKINQAGKVVVGTSADYPPYEYIDEAGNKTGFDIDLMTEIAKRMGVELEWVDMPFDSLVAAVDSGKLDMSISCFNYDEERDKTVDFSEAYYTTEDAFVVTSAFAGTITVPEDAANYKVGVQSGTVQDGWLTDNLVTPGLLPEASLSRYERVDQAALDLANGRIDVLMGDYVPIQALVAQNPDLQVVYHGELSTGPINIVLPDGDAALKAEVDRIIKELQAEGFIDQLAVKYFSE